jgi:hypothetical protein
MMTLTVKVIQVAEGTVKYAPEDVQGTNVLSVDGPALAELMGRAGKPMVRKVTQWLAALPAELVQGAMDAMEDSGLLGALSLSSLVDGGALLKFMLSNSRAERAMVEDADFTLSALFIMLLMAPVLMAWWFAPVLAAWHRLGVGKALFFSFIACWMNWRPFLVYGLGLLIVAGILPGVLLGILLLVMPGAANLVTALVTMPMVLVIAPTIFASFYASYRDIFGISEIV